MKHISSFIQFVNESKRSIIDYSTSNNKIIVGLKTNLLSDMKDRYEYTQDGNNIHFFNKKGNHFATLFDVGTRHQMLHHDGSLNDKGWLIEGQRHKPVNHIEDIKIDDDSDKKAEDEIQDYLEDNIDTCARCGEHIDDCKCESGDPWSTQNFHRIPKGDVEKSKPKQNFKN